MGYSRMLGDTYRQPGRGCGGRYRADGSRERVILGRRHTVGHDPRARHTDGLGDRPAADRPLPVRLCT